MNQNEFINYVIEERYKPGLRKIKNKVRLDDNTCLEEIMKTLKNDFDICYSPIGNAILNTIYAKKFDEYVESIMKDENIDNKIVIGRDCNLLSGYMVGCSRECFNFGYTYSELKEDTNLIDYIINKKLVDSRSDFRNLKREIYENFDVDEPVIICDTGLSDTQQVILAKYLKFKDTILVLGEGHFNTREFKTINLGIKSSYLESQYHPIKPYKEINKIVKKDNLSKTERENIHLYCLVTEELMKNKSVDKALDRIIYKYTNSIFGDE